MSDWIEDMKAMVGAEADARTERRRRASDVFEDARVMAEASGLRFRCIADAQYQLEHPTKKWLLNIYPGNRRVYMDRNRPKAPYLRLPPEWTLLDVVRAAIAKS